ncbi:RNA methyltransferase, RsmD family [Ehrlichia chaffeensis str. Heartland]|uniref:16S rRNA (guanine(966)-N(2))-methyltransferase RsmD n=1 Tax=Ehrlichia chaffeensis TaxID=945 RepID=UPI000444D8D2|nr:16S rRNA (guanine(966)-N(2))-methyltransferase RsmD [Ehrlichia chaffeensis]AHX03346.1 RNA methyltransferase, RsmD family [Ehrlichia chaffeensis str. Heartland]AHX05935.1 RNA methyltransferase, RsmD family [Ehrlichia chaffeensis str. Jax]AHX06925.1 RNA methyltransferase, RsmD family [Ehrlichia chaffeensis str. Liberty]AHX08115.1 RNA methyltransferase, RsmD family [Ehrlichia chaffeensis str. Saint Vincent]AHX09175.1 RNA methyltransferase, RsmD family [Ehrlichia chaffeensis str. Wakulla]
MLRITSGKYRGRRIFSDKLLSARPAMSIIRESIFNIILSRMSIQGCKILDLFCGSGSLSFEALSRGAESALLVDINHYNLSLVKRTSEYLGVVNNVTLMCCDVEKLPLATDQYDIVFVDPPYTNPNLVDMTLNVLIKLNWVKSSSIVVVRIRKKVVFVCPIGYRIMVERTYGISKVIMLQREF